MARRPLRQRHLRERRLHTQGGALKKRRSWKTRDEARLAVFTYIETFYNPKRRNSSLSYLSPDDYEKMINITNSNDRQIATTC